MTGTTQNLSSWDER